MARADSTITTRRSLVRLAGAAAGVALLPTASAPHSDAELIHLSERLIYATADLNAAADRSTEEEVQAKYAEGRDIFDRIFELQATSFEGAKAKASALYWIHGEDADGWDCQYTFGLIEDLLAIVDKAGR